MHPAPVHFTDSDVCPAELKSFPCYIDIDLTRITGLMLIISVTNAADLKSENRSGIAVNLVNG